MFFESDFGRVVYDCYTPSNPNGIVVQIAHGMVEHALAMHGCAKSSLGTQACHAKGLKKCLDEVVRISQSTREESASHPPFFLFRFLVSPAFCFLFPCL